MTRVIAGSGEKVKEASAPGESETAVGSSSSTATPNHVSTRARCRQSERWMACSASMRLRSSSSRAACPPLVLRSKAPRSW